MKPLSALLALLVLASCGADGEPIRPTVSGNTEVGVNSSRGTYTRSAVGVEVKL